MATVTTRYRCPVSPDECPSSPRRGYCKIHEWEQLVPERVYLTAESADAAGAAGPGHAEHEAGGPDRERTGRSQGAGGRDGETPRADPAVGPHTPSGRSAPGAPPPPTRLQSTPASGPAPHQDSRRRVTPDPAPATPQLALVLAGALVPVRGPGQDPTRLGRDASDCAHVPGLAALDQISREHAELSWHAGRLYITDIDSSNGTYVDDERIARPAQLWPGVHRLRLAQPPEAVEVTVVELDEYGAPR